MLLSIVIYFYLKSLKNIPYFIRLVCQSVTQKYERFLVKEPGFFEIVATRKYGCGVL